MRHLLTCLFVLTMGLHLHAQLPTTEVFLLELQDNERVKKLSYLTDFNTDSYNNQAVFVNKNEVLLTSLLEDDQTDIVKLNLKAKTWKRMTATEESEYSPRANGEASFTVVRVELDGETQTLWEYPFSLLYEGQLLMENTGQVGYYRTLPNLKVALFVIENTMNLYIGDARQNVKTLKEENIGRCFQVSKTGELWYASKTEADGKIKIKTYNTVNSRFTTIASGLQGSQDFCLYDSTEKLIMARDAQLFQYDQKSATWKLWLDLTAYGLTKITRLDCINNQILLTNIPN